MDEAKSSEVFEFSKVDSDSVAPNKTRKRKRCFLDSQWKLRLEFAVLVTMIAIVWGLFSLPIVLHYDYSSRELNGGENVTSPANATDSNFGNTSDECSNKYTGIHCRDVLKSYADCESPERITTDVYVSNTVIDQKSVEDIVDSIIFALDLYIKPSDDCRKAVVPLLCMYYFGLCGRDNVDYRLTAAECKEVRESTCESEWKAAERLLELSGQQSLLPDCSSLGDVGLECDRAFALSGANCTIVCHKHFYCENNFCKPHCDGFTFYSDEYVKLSDALIITFGCVGFLCGIAVVGIFFLRRKTLMTFPAILIFYLTISIIFLEFIILVSLMDRPTFFCSSPDLAESLRSPTNFCKFIGFIDTYAIIHFALWWILNIAAIYWKVRFPFHSRYYDQSNRTRRVHIGCVIIAIVLPFYAPIALFLKGGFNITRFPPTICLGRDVDTNFYSVIAPTTVILAIGTTMLLLLLWRIRQNMGNHNTGKSTNKFILSPAERKVLVVFLYYLFFGVLQLSTISLYVNNIDHNIKALGGYFQCQRSGLDESCSLNARFSEFWSLFAFIVLLLLPVINLYFALKLKNVRLLCNCCKDSIRVTEVHSNPTSNSISS